MRRAMLLGVLCALATTATADPIHTRDQNPLLAGFGLPIPFAADVSALPRWSSSLDFNWSSTASILQDGARTLTVDAESQELRLTLRRTVGERLAVQLRAPYRETSGGSLDGFIDDWHDFFSLPEGERPLLPQDQFQLRFEDGGVTRLLIEDDRRGLGDIALDVGFQVRSTASSAASVWFTLEAPTGDARELTGNEAVDLGLAFAGVRQLDEGWRLFGQAAVTWFGEDDWLGLKVKRTAWSALGGVSWRAADWIEFVAQLDGHTAVFDEGDLDLLGHSVALTLGGGLHFGSGWRLQLAVTEDIAVETTSDVTFVLSLSRGARQRDEG